MARGETATESSDEPEKARNCEHRIEQAPMESFPLLSNDSRRKRKTVGPSVSKSMGKAAASLPFSLARRETWPASYASFERDEA
jgi:hypothetical protein